MYSGNYIPTGRSYSCRQVGVCAWIFIPRVRAGDASLPITIPFLHADASVSQLPYSVSIMRRTRLGQLQCCVIGLLVQQYPTCALSHVLSRGSLRVFVSITQDAMSLRNEVFCLLLLWLLTNLGGKIWSDSTGCPSSPPRSSVPPAWWKGTPWAWQILQWKRL